MYVVECYWPGVTEEVLAETLARTRAAALQLRHEGRSVELRGTILLRNDETVFCLFDGDERDVRAAGELGGMPLERVLESVWLEPAG